MGDAEPHGENPPVFPQDLLHLRRFRECAGDGDFLGFVLHFGNDQNSDAAITRALGIIGIRDDRAIVGIADRNHAFRRHAIRGE